MLHSKVIKTVKLSIFVFVLVLMNTHYLKLTKAESPYARSVPHYTISEIISSNDGIMIGVDGDIWDGKNYKLADGTIVKDAFFYDGSNTYYLQADGTPMINRLTYHPDGEHIIYFDENGHEVFSDFANVKRSIEGEPVDDLCFFDVYGYMYTNVLTYDKSGEHLYYANPYGVMECDGWFKFDENAGGVAEAFGITGDTWGYAYKDGVVTVESIGDENNKNNYHVDSRVDNETGERYLFNDFYTPIGITKKKKYFDKNGNLSETVLIKDDNVIERWVYRYDEENQLIFKSVNNEKTYFEWEYAYINEYYNNNVLKKRIIITNDIINYAGLSIYSGNREGIFFENYNEHGIMIESGAIDSDNKYICHFLYNDEGSLISQTRFHDNGNVWYIKKYDYGREFLCNEYDEDGRLKKGYDENGNWINEEY